jgi:AraC-like DNA-binding protein
MNPTEETMLQPRQIEMPAEILAEEALQGSSLAEKAPLATATADARLAIAFVARRYPDKFPASAVASHCGLSRFQFSRAFHATFRITFREYLLRYRIRAAYEALTRHHDSVTAVAYAVGFHDGSYFARMFRRYIGMLPSQYARWHDRPDRSTPTTP